MATDKIVAVDLISLAMTPAVWPSGSVAPALQPDSREGTASFITSGDAWN